MNTENDPQIWQDYINDLMGEDEELSPELARLGDILEINYTVKKKKS